MGRRRLRSNLDLEFNNSTIQLNFDNVTVDLLITLTLYLLNETSTPSQALEPEVQAAAAQSIAAITQLYDTANSSTLLNQISTASQSWMSDLLRALGNSRVGVDEFKAQSSKESIAAQVGAINPPFDDDHQASISGLSIGSPAFIGMVASVATLSLAVVAIGVWLRTRQRRSTEVRRAPAVLNQLNIMDRAWSALPTPPRPMVQHIQASPTRARHTATLTPDFDAPPPRKSAARRLTQI